jgi:hypothetical protein
LGRPVAEEVRKDEEGRELTWENVKKKSEAVALKWDM